VRLTLGRRSILSEVVVVGRDGTGDRTVVAERVGLRRGIGFLYDPAWSPDGGTIVYTRWQLHRQSHFRTDLRAVGSDGRGDRLLVRDASEADWSPDGARIAYTSIHDRNGRRCGSDVCQYAGELYLMDASGRGHVRLTRGEGNESSPDWSPDGRWIAFASDRNYPDGEHFEIYSIRADGACLDWLTNGSAESMSPAWRPTPGATGDRGQCGATRRPALAELDLGPLLSISRPRLYWLGPSFAGLIPSEVDADDGHAYLAYDDCIRFDPGRCPPSVELNQGSVCDDYRLLLALVTGRGAPRRARGAVIAGRIDLGELGVLARPDRRERRLRPCPRARRAGSRSSAGFQQGQAGRPPLAARRAASGRPASHRAVRPLKLRASAAARTPTLRPRPRSARIPPRGRRSAGGSRGR
jgi:hypothetical protein